MRVDVGKPCLDIGDGLRIRVDRLRHHAFGQDPAFRIQDGASHRTQGHGALLLLGGAREVVFVAKDLDLSQAGHDDHRCAGYDSSTASFDDCRPCITHQ